MEGSQPHLEILSRNRINRSTIIVAIIPTTIFSLVLVYALWDFLTWVAYGVLALLSIGALYLIAILVIDVRRRWIAAHVIHLGEYGVVDASNWRMLPLALPPPQITVTEQPNEDDDEVLLAKVRLFHDVGYSIQRIATETGLKPWKVQKWTADYEKAKKAKQQRQAEQTNGV